MPRTDHDAGRDPGPPGSGRLREELRSAVDLVQLDQPPLAILERAAARRRRTRLTILAVAAATAGVIGVGAAVAGLRAAGAPVAGPGPGPTPGQHASGDPGTHSGTGVPACGPGDLAVSWLPYGHSSMPGVVYFLRLRNTARYTCVIKGYPGLEVAGPATLHGNRAMYAPGNAALGRIPVAGIHLAPGHAVLSQVMFGGSVGWTGCVSPEWKVTVPLSRGRQPVRLTMPKSTEAQLCDDMPYLVSPVYPASRGGLPPSPGGTPPGSGHHQADYQHALATVRAYLATWKSKGLRVANDQFLPPQYGPRPGPYGPRLLSGKVTGFQPVSWTSPDEFTLVVDMDLRFPGTAQAWGQGVNTRFVTFAKAPGTPTGYRMTLATGP